MYLLKDNLARLVVIVIVHVQVRRLGRTDDRRHISLCWQRTHRAMLLQRHCPHHDLVERCSHWLLDQARCIVVEGDDTRVILRVSDADVRRAPSLD